MNPDAIVIMSFSSILGILGQYLVGIAGVLIVVAAIFNIRTSKKNGEITEKLKDQTGKLAEQAESVAWMAEACLLTPEYTDFNEPVHPCRIMPTRHCPVQYRDICGVRPCARYEDEVGSPFLPELRSKRTQA